MATPPIKKAIMLDFFIVKISSSAHKAAQKTSWRGKGRTVHAALGLGEDWQGPAIRH
ncbi:hypothetical protein [Novosphingobium barchaimii]|uniref:hypothetical protein n=1 Tax=Novosphingobium barchaimii TaxID=1420591 RepID=UPI00146FD5BB|nr:hypothetical protein [Novosphingobium barchaimii]